MSNRWWGTRPNRSGPVTQSILLAFPLLSAVGYGAGLAIAGAAGAAWGTLIAAALPVVLMFGMVIIPHWIKPPVYNPPDPVTTPVPTAMLPSPR